VSGEQRDLGYCQRSRETERELTTKLSRSATLSRLLDLDAEKQEVLVCFDGGEGTGIASSRCLAGAARLWMSSPSATMWRCATCHLRDAHTCSQIIVLKALAARTRVRAMDFLKSAVASAISKGPAFPYSFDDRVDIDQSIWTLHNSTKRV
jgi:hypothetical protein